MPAQTAPKESKKIGPDHDLIKKFSLNYGSMLAEAKVSAEHTATEGWRKLYAERRSATIKARNRIAAGLKESAEIMEANGLSEEGEKELGDLKKQATELRERCEAFDRDTVGPIKMPVSECERILLQAKDQAQRDESIYPLVNNGLSHAMSQVIAAVERPTWDADTGTVKILSPQTAS